MHTYLVLIEMVREETPHGIKKPKALELRVLFSGIDVIQRQVVWFSRIRIHGVVFCCMCAVHSYRQMGQSRCETRVNVSTHGEYS